MSSVKFYVKSKFVICLEVNIPVSSIFKFRDLSFLNFCLSLRFQFPTKEIHYDSIESGF